MDTYENSNLAMMGLHGGVVVSTVASEQERSRFDSQLGPFCVCMISPCMRVFSALRCLAACGVEILIKNIRAANFKHRKQLTDFSPEKQQRSYSTQALVDLRHRFLLTSWLKTV